MECKASDSKKLFKVFEAKRKKSRKKKDGLDETNSLVTDESNSLARAKTMSIKSARASLQDLSTAQIDGLRVETPKRVRDRESSPSVSRSPAIEVHRAPRSPRRHRRPQREGISLALNAGLVSTPRSISPQQDGDGVQDDYIYTFLEEAIKRDKKKHRHSRRHEEHRKRDCEHERERERERDRDRERELQYEGCHEHRHHHRRRRDDIPSRDHDEPPKETFSKAAEQALLFETFAKLCSTFTEKTNAPRPITTNEVLRSQSHKSLQCEVVSQREQYDHRPVRLQSREPSHAGLSRTRVRSHDDLHVHESRPRLATSPACVDDTRHKYYPPYEAKPKYSKLNVTPSRRDIPDDRYARDRDYQPCPARSCMDHAQRREYREYEDHRREPVRERRTYDEDKRRYLEPKTSRSFDVRRETCDDERCRRTSRSESHRKRYDELRDPRDRRYDDQPPRGYDDRRDKYYEDKDRDRHYANFPSKDRRSKRNLERFERCSVVSRDDDRDRDRFSERERDSGLSVADGENSTVSGKSNYLRVVKQEIAEQREAMDKMMKLWKELMRCFKGVSHNQTQGQGKAIHESAATVQESAEAQLRLWRECMRRYETVARDVGDTDARLMDEIAKQRSEMAEMATMWQECLQRYRTISNDFDTLKRQLEVEGPRAQPSPAPPLAGPESEGAAPPAAPYRMPPNMYPPMGVYGPGSPLRTRASAPPAWWWCNEPSPPPPPPRRRSSPDSRSRSRSRDRHRHRKDRNEGRYSKDKSSTKPAGGRSDHRHRKR